MHEAMLLPCWQINRDATSGARQHTSLACSSVFLRCSQGVRQRKRNSCSNILSLSFDSDDESDGAPSDDDDDDDDDEDVAVRIERQPLTPVSLMCLLILRPLDAPSNRQPLSHARNHVHTPALQADWITQEQ